ncbi:MAG: HD domain-containing protein [Coriobacteriia bacterium]|nr:HD domain-containing protein [Coriobacteriia bacterium]
MIRDLDIHQALAVVKARLSKKAVGHAIRVGDTAAALAIVYGVNPEYAKIAGLLHDWDREKSGRQLIVSATEAGIEVTDADRVVPYLLHSKTGAVALQRTYPDLPAEVLDAIRCHTVGAPTMSDLDKIVYLADMIAPARDFPGVNELREAVGVVTLAELFARGYQLSVMHLVRSRRRLHPDTVAVWNSLVVKEKHE